MNKSLFILILSSFTLFHYQSANIALANKPFFRFKPRKKPKAKIKHYGKEKIAFSLAINTGYKRLLSKDQRKRYQELNLLHIFTPSGLHLLPLSILMKSIFSKSGNIIINFILYIIFFTSGSFWSIRRILFLRTSFEIFDNKELNFALCFLFDFFIGGYSESPLSFTFSYLFLGCVLLSNSKKEFYLSISLAQMISSYFFGSEFYLLAPVFSIFLSSLFSLVFIFSFINHWIFYNFELPLYLNFLNLYYDSLVKHLYELIKLSPKLNLELCTLIFFFIVVNKFKRVVLMITLFSTLSLNDQNKLNSHSKTFYSRLMKTKEPSTRTLDIS